MSILFTFGILNLIFTYFIKCSKNSLLNSNYKDDLTYLLDVQSNECPRYKCDDLNSDKCLIMSKADNIKKITLSICNHTDYCDYDFQQIQTKVSYTAHCKPKEAEPLKRYPGEQCLINGDCVDFSPNTGVCIHGEGSYGKCSGLGLNEVCVNDSECLRGLYCNNTETEKGKCVKQLAEGAECNKETACLNQFACYNNTCIRYFSLDKGMRVDKTLTGSIADPKTLCKFGYINKNNECDEVFHSDKVNTKTKLVSCNIGQKCNYTDSVESFTLDCDCGYNENGSSYCPSKIYDKSDWEKFYKAVSFKYKNNCHTLSRSDCYINKLSSKKNINSAAFKTVNRHLYYKAPECAFEVLEGSSNLIKINIFLIILLFLISI